MELQVKIVAPNGAFVARELSRDTDVEEVLNWATLKFLEQDHLRDENTFLVFNENRVLPGQPVENYAQVGSDEIRFNLRQEAIPSGGSESAFASLKQPGAQEASNIMGITTTVKIKTNTDDVNESRQIIERTLANATPEIKDFCFELKAVINPNIPPILEVAWRADIPVSNFTGYIPSEGAPEPELTGAEEIAAERKRHTEVEGWTPEHDDTHTNGELTAGAACYIVCAEELANGLSPGEIRDMILCGEVECVWPFEKEWLKVDADPKRNLAKAGAFLAAEWDRLKRKEKV